MSITPDNNLPKLHNPVDDNFSAEKSDFDLIPNAIEVKNVSVAYRSYKERPSTLKETLIKFMKSGKVKYYSTFDALNNISFNVKRGEVFGVIGSNGAGKSTLLKVMSGVLPPTSGTANVLGTVDSLIQLGAGFDSDLNAIENIYLSGSLRRHSREVMKQQIPSILEFAELQEFAHIPIRYYSSGMFARLGFSVAINRNPDVLLVDEVLAVGDERFQQKCRKVFEKYLEAGKTIVMVSHSMDTIERLATRIMLLSKGQIVYTGNPKDAVRLYRDQNYKLALDGNRLN